MSTTLSATVTYVDLIESSLTISLFPNDSLMQFTSSALSFDVDPAAFSVTGEITSQVDFTTLNGLTQTYNIVVGSADEIPVGGVGIDINDQQVVFVGAGASEGDGTGSGTGQWQLMPPTTPSLLFASKKDNSNWTASSAVPSAFSSGSNVAMASFNSQLQTVWRGYGDDSAVYTERYDPTKQSWDNFGTIPGAFTNKGYVGAAQVGDNLYVAWPGVTDDAQIYYASQDANNHWSDVNKIPGAFTDTGPALALFDNCLYAIWQGVSDPQVYYNILSADGQWLAGGPQKLIDGNTQGGIALCSTGPTLYAVWVGLEDSGQMYYASLQGGGTWSAPEQMGGAFSSSGPSLTLHDNTLLACWKGQQGDTRVFTATLQGDGTWSQPQSIEPGQFITEQGMAVGSIANELYMGWIG